MMDGYIFCQQTTKEQDVNFGQGHYFSIQSEMLYTSLQIMIFLFSIFILFSRTFFNQEKQIDY